MITKKYNLKVQARNSNFESVKITRSLDLDTFCRKFYKDDIEIYESFFICLLDRANNVTGYVKISQGGVAGTIVDLKIILKYAIDTLASGVALCHNHPSGAMTPSTQDLIITKQIKEGLKMIDCTLIDHIILGANGAYYSFSDNGTL